jgi:hypothetical protein
MYLYQSLNWYSVCMLCMHSNEAVFGVKRVGEGKSCFN